MSADRRDRLLLLVAELADERAPMRVLLARGEENWRRFDADLERFVETTHQRRTGPVAPCSYICAGDCWTAACDEHRRNVVGDG